jgi:hypothetical protein
LPVEPIEKVTDEFSELWDDCKQQYGVTTVRDRAFMEWRHVQAPRVWRASHLLACREGGKLRGFASLAEPLRDDGFTPDRWQLTDLFYDRTRPDVLASLMNRAFEYAVAKGCAVFEVSQVATSFQHELMGDAPVVRQAETWNYWYKAPSAELARLCQQESWWPSGVDGDSNL